MLLCFVYFLLFEKEEFVAQPLFFALTANNAMQLAFDENGKPMSWGNSPLYASTPSAAQHSTFQLNTITVVHVNANVKCSFP